LSWGADWIWGLPLLVFTIVAHVCALLAIAKIHERYRAPETPNAARFVLFVALVALAAAALLALEAAAWAELYSWLGATAGTRAAMLYSVGALTSYGHAEIFLESRWQLLGAIEAVNGMILFGLTTAFLFASIQQVWPLRRQ
jgi:hypothetical protein